MHRDEDDDDDDDDDDDESAVISLSRLVNVVRRFMDMRQVATPCFTYTDFPCRSNMSEAGAP